MRQLNERRAVVLDSHPLWLDAVERVLERIGVSVTEATTSGDEAIAALEREDPDLVIVGVDADAQGDRGLEIAAATRARLPEACIIALGEDRAAESLAAAFGAGANAYVLRNVHPDDLAAAVRQSFGPSIYFANSPVHQQASSRPRAAAATQDAGLTRREVEILRLVSDGYSNGALARLLWVTEQTVKFHLSNIYRKLGVSNRTEASRWAQLNGILESEPAEETRSHGADRVLVGAAG